MGPQLRALQMGQAVAGIHLSIQRCLLDLKKAIPKGLNTLGNGVGFNITCSRKLLIRRLKLIQR